MPREAICAARISATSAASVWLRRDGHLVHKRLDKAVGDPQRNIEPS
jgi:hypothetical protein